MSLLFELEQHQKLVVYEEGNQILAVRLPLRRGGEFRMRDGCLSDLTGVIYRGNIRLAWQSLEHHIILSGTEEQSDRIVLSDGYHVRQYGGLKLVTKDQGLWLLYSAKEPEKDVWHAMYSRWKRRWENHRNYQERMKNGRCCRQFRREDTHFFW
ncbi:hypothetical protein DW058_07390 [Clostridiaceae bacterium AF42-6]|nr:hypothetical protein DW058_07390 [Clostridiaceae bacterium AF42-6]